MLSVPLMLMAKNASPPATVFETLQDSIAAMCPVPVVVRLTVVLVMSVSVVLAVVSSWLVTHSIGICAS
jgi:hypothetical protein